MMMRSITLVAALALIPCASLAARHSPERLGQLYFDDLALVNDYDTVTAFVTDGSPDPAIASSFNTFAQRIGRNNGATHIDARDYGRYAEAFATLQCRPIKPPAVLFLDRAQGRCESLPLTNPQEVRTALVNFETILACPRNRRGLTLARLTAHASLEQFAADNVIARALLPSVDGLVDWLLPSVVRACRRTAR